MTEQHKAVVLGANYYIGLSIIRCLGRVGIPVVAVEYKRDGAYGLHSKYLSEELIGPNYKEEPEALKDFLIEYAKKQDKKPVLYPTADPYVEFIDAYLDELGEYYLITQKEKGLWTKLIDKDDLYEIAEQHNVRMPKSIQTSRSDLIETVESELGYPCLVKPADSTKFVAKFRRKLFKVQNRTELEEALKKAADADIEVVVQQLVQGFDDHMYTFDAYLNQNSEVTHWMTAQKHRQYPIHFGASVYTKQRYVPELFDIGAPFLEAIGYKGFAEIEFKKDANTGDYYLIEINVRTTNFNQMIADVGLNMPLIAYKELTGQPIGTRVIKEDTGQVFHYMYEDLHASRAYVKAGDLTWSQILKSYKASKTGAVWAKDDPQPGIQFIGKFVKRVAGKVTRRNG
ncbi:carboxylate--amine ligase [Marinilactibacillus sp. XAAS-LB27]|uniref:carboxylate--amine ligase n=1 Tax=Marinilactibacillus sp. XAAS-LB27 TaxID=3114538 RepID=UPI002E18DC23|nr:carboxylate--amine ligase [Marinilactibacillus sp. XAAS-LB27]